MAPNIKVLDKEFELYIPETEIQERIGQLAIGISKDLQHLNPLFISILNGAFFFTADLLKRLPFDCEISFVKIASYEGLASTGNIKTLIGLDENLEGRHIVLVEDIVDTGYTIHTLRQWLAEKKVASIRTAALTIKREAMKINVPVEYIGFEVPDIFLVGYGLDYIKHGRNFTGIYRLKG